MSLPPVAGFETVPVSPMNAETALPKKILLVEDNAANASFLIIMMEMLGHECVHAKNGRETLDFAKNEEFNLILLDLNLPDMSGFEVSQCLCNMEGSLIPPIVGFSADVSSAIIEKAREAGMKTVRTKAVDVDELQGVVDEFAA